MLTKGNIGDILKQKGISLGTLTEMQSRIAECHLEKGDLAATKKEYEQALALLDLLDASPAWDAERNFFKRQIAAIKGKL